MFQQGAEMLWEAALRAIFAGMAASYNCKR